ncbi:serine protease 55 [Talpa occidentalis]|uniref:serine protease 55 n=1 Tax=Talpa occidentalis TaxID=50954 RepID=UPI00188ED78F|nr:serine protease 55 [Talpa occidentalis]
MFLLSALLLVARARGTPGSCGERPVFEGGTRYSRIIEGAEAGEGEFPWQVSVQARSQPFCGGSIISEWWVLTAAHCFHNTDLSPEDVMVGLGSSDLSSTSLELKQVSRIILHKDFRRSDMNNDIALLLLQSPIVLDGLKTPICMPWRPGLAKWRECWVAGWGQTRSDDEHSTTSDLLKVPMAIMDWEGCAKTFPKLTKNMLCAGYHNKSYDACQGDSGGPLACLSVSDRRWYQVGIISWGRSCGQKDVPGIYTLLENYSSWVKKVAELEGRPLGARKMSSAAKQRPPSSWAAPPPGTPQPRALTPAVPLVLPAVLGYFHR